MKRMLFATTMIAGFALQAVAASFCNPLDLPYRMRPEEGKNFREGADPEAILHDGRYWMFASKCGGYFVSDGLAKWTLVKTADLPLEEYAPTVEVIDGKMHFSSRGGTVHRADDLVAGKWTRLEKRMPHTVDSKLYRDDDGRIYDYWGGGERTQPIFGVELDAISFRDKGKAVPLFDEDRFRYGWEVRGHENEKVDTPSYLEGANMFKRGGKYYFQYAGPGTQYASYSDTALIGDSPLGPFMRQKLNPFSYKPRGYTWGAGHGNTFADKYGNVWHVTTCTINGVDRRLVMFPVFFDADGEMWCDTAYADWPMAIPDKRADSPADYHLGWMPLTYGKKVTVTSAHDPHSDPAKVTDEDVRNCWSAASGTAGESATVDLGGEAEVRAVQIGFADVGQADAWRAEGARRRYLVETTTDGVTWRTIVDESDANDAADHPYRVLPAPVRATALRVVCVEMPKGTFFALREIRAFGRMAKPLPEVPKGVTVERDAADRRIVRASWPASQGATGYVLRYGPAPEKMHLAVLVRGGTAITLRSLDSQRDYHFSVEAFNEAGTVRAVK